MTVELIDRAPTGSAAIVRDRLAPWADGLAIALAVSLPWSTSATGIIAGLWLVALVPTLDRQALHRVLTTPAGGLPVLLWAMGLVGMLWADVPLAERLDGLGPYHKLLCIPLLMAQFDRSERAPWLLAGFLGSCILLLALSFVLVLFPAFPWMKTKMPGIPVKNYAAQSELFTICIFVLAEMARQCWLRARPVAASGFLTLALIFLVNILFIATTRTSLVVIPILLLLCGFRWLGWRGAAVALILSVALNASSWVSSPFFRDRVASVPTEMKDYAVENKGSSSGERLEFWRKSLRFVADAPLIGHGTGSITDQYRRAAVGQTGVAAVVSSNPHNQVLTVAVQLGLTGAALLLALWMAHLLAFRGAEFAAWIGTVVVVQNMIGSLFNSQLFDFTHGWAYVIGVGVCGGVMLVRRLDHGEPLHRA